MKQMTFASLALERRRNQTRRERFLAETLATGAQIKTYIWDDGRLVGLLDHGTTPPTLLTLDLDQLGTPRVARNAQGTVVWRWDSDGYGTTLPNEDPDGNGTKTTIHLRFPGQYYDQESGLHYNWHRYYSPRLGRYISADPIGVEGGANLYSYVGANPLSRADPEGLMGAAPGKGGGYQPGEGPGQGFGGFANGIGNLLPNTCEGKCNLYVGMICGPLAGAAGYQTLGAAWTTAFAACKVQVFTGCFAACEDPNCLPSK
ncbi:MAG: RHS repeat-associated core domain-containing protein [Zoogloeaceae bacterium]|nr:RHS repeat-associated core domain-containing protein [Zoogloeaceae bacterium]